MRVVNFTVFDGNSNFVNTVTPFLKTFLNGVRVNYREKSMNFNHNSVHNTW